jgi:hypothetical protein
VAPIALATCAALALFARRSSQIAAGALSVAGLALLAECEGALVGSPERTFFISGTVLFGWLLGLAYARIAGVRDERAERLAEFGGAGALGAVYVSAGLSKLIASGLGWADANNLRAVVFAQRPVHGGGLTELYARALGDHPHFAMTLTIATLVTQLGAAFFPWTPRSRAVCGSMILGFHLNVWALTPIVYLQSIVMVAAFAYPWPWIVGKLRGHTPERDEPSPVPLDRSATIVTVAIVAVALTVATLGPVRRYTHLLDRPEPTNDASRAVAPAPRPGPWPADLGVLLGAHEGDAITGDWHYGLALASPDGGAEIEANSRDARFTITIRRHGASPHPPPVSTDRYDLFYSRETPAALPSSTRDAVLGAVAASVRNHEARVPMPTWMSRAH